MLNGSVAAAPTLASLFHFTHTHTLRIFATVLAIVDFILVINIVLH
jgi:hypothetical protein